MKKMYSKLALAALLFINVSSVFAQEATQRSVNQSFKEYFIKGGPAYMAPILLCLIIGLAVAIERIIYLTMSTTNTKKLLENVEDALKNGAFGKERILDFPIYLHCSDAWVHGNGNWYDSGL